MECRHLDGDRTNCAATNLVWGTSSRNQIDKVIHGTHHYSRREECGRGHLLEGDNLSIRLAADGSFKQRVCLQCRRDDAAERAAQMPPRIAPCGTCGQPFEKPRAPGKAKLRYCSPECLKVARDAQVTASRKRRSGMLESDNSVVYDRVGQSNLNG